MTRTAKPTPRRTAVVAALILGALLFTAPAFAAEYLGDFCWRATKTENQAGVLATPEIFTLKLSLTYVGGLSYSAEGFIIATGDNNPIISGGGVANSTGTELLFTMAFAQEHKSAYRDSGVFQARLNTTTWGGTFFSIWNSFNTSTRGFSNGYAKGTVAFVACPQ